MSYEGRVQVINRFGYLSEHDDSGSNGYTLKKDDRWVNNIDDTYYTSVGEIPKHILIRFYLKDHNRVQTCNMGHVHEVKPEIYRIPGPESKYLRHDVKYDYKHSNGQICEPIYPVEYNKLCVRKENGEIFGMNPEPMDRPLTEKPKG